MKRKLLASLIAASLLASTAALAAGNPAIYSVTTDTAMSVAVIKGANFFQKGPSVRVFLSGQAAPLTVLAASGDEVTVVLPPGMSPGSYSLLLGSGATSSDFDEFFVTLGNTGAQGPKGDRGEKGDKGDKGDKGEKGDTGATGAAGPQGPDGAVGPQGAQGAQGPQGVTGAQGATGAQGPKGDKGDTGAIGVQGSKGDKGDKGDAGAAGPQGPQGATGPQGPQGIAGTSGQFVKYVTANSNFQFSASPSTATWQTIMGTTVTVAAAADIVIGYNVTIQNNGTSQCPLVVRANINGNTFTQTVINIPPGTTGSGGQTVATPVNPGNHVILIEGFNGNPACPSLFAASTSWAGGFWGPTLTVMTHSH
jgi:hypothetical protein